MVNLSSAMAAQFVEMVKDAVNQIEALGPNPLRNHGTENEPSNISRQSTIEIIDA
jgi:hypothetical protein